LLQVGLDGSAIGGITFIQLQFRQTDFSEQNFIISASNNNQASVPADGFSNTPPAAIPERWQLYKCKQSSNS
jgi:hypothetical protein